MRQSELEKIISNYKDENFLILLLFKGERCIPCDILSSKLSRLTKLKELKKKTKLIKFTIEDEPTYHYEVKAVPTLIIYKKENLVYRYTGDLNEETLLSKLNELLSE